MIVPELTDYIHEQTQQGVSAQALRESLIERGWQAHDVENALRDVAAGLRPVTAGASIHEELAQVRSVVAHLAARVQYLESTFIGPAHELEQKRNYSIFWRLISLILLLGASTLLGFYAPQIRDGLSLAPLTQVSMITALGFVFLLLALLALHARRQWEMMLWTALAVALWLVDVWIAWRLYHFMEWTIAAALAVLFVVLALVLGRRLERP